MQDRIEKAARRALRRRGVRTKGHEAGSGIFYEYSLGRAIGRPGAVPGLLVQLSHARWWFAAGTRAGDVVYPIAVDQIVDMTRVAVPEGVVLVIEADPTEEEEQMGLAEPTIYQFLAGGRDAEAAAKGTLAAIAYDAELVDSQGRPTDFWKEIVEEGDTVIRRTLKSYDETGRAGYPF